MPARGIRRALLPSGARNTNRENLTGQWSIAFSQAHCNGLDQGFWGGGAASCWCCGKL